MLPIMWKVYSLKQELLQLAKRNGGSRILHPPRKMLILKCSISATQPLARLSPSGLTRPSFDTPPTACECQLKHSLGGSFSTLRALESQIHLCILRQTPETVLTRAVGLDTFTNPANTDLPNLVLNNAPWDKTLQPAHGDRQHRWQASPQCARL